MDSKQLKLKWLESQKYQEKFVGWDFSYLEGKYECEETPWCYSEIVSNFLKPEMTLLDMGTGGGELLQTFNHPYHLTSVTEGWDKNYQLLLRTLKPKGINVQFVDESDKLNFPDNAFDIVLNSHESFSISEVKRVLKPNGIFITQQVGDLNGITLSSKLIRDFKKEKFDWHLFPTVDSLQDEGFQIIYKNEAYPIQKFFDMDGLIYYVRTIKWEFPNFSVENNFDELCHIYDELLRNGYIYNLEHRFVVIARNVKPRNNE